MNSNQLKFAEIFSFLALIFFLMFIFVYQNNQILTGNEPDTLIVLNKELKESNEQLQNHYQKLEDNYKQIKEDKERLETANSGLYEELLLERQVDKASKKFPNQITIPNTGKYAFSFGTAILTPDLSQFIQGEVVTKIKQAFNDSEIKINVIEVIGHTDAVPVNGSSNLDQRLNKVANNPNSGVNILRAGSNTDLGLMRALSVVKALEQNKELMQFFKEQGLIENTQDNRKTIFRAYSAAQLYDSNGKLVSSNARNQSSRRIEIRFTYIEP